MGKFGSTVASLIETYSACLKLLKRLADGNKGHGSADEGEWPTKLRKSIRADRTKIRQAFSSRLSLNGDQFDKGDAVAKSSLRKVVQRLTKAIKRLLDTSPGARNPSLDIEYVQSLSNLTRVDAIRTIDDLSDRLSSRSSTRSSRRKARGRPQSVASVKPSSARSSHRRSVYAVGKGPKKRSQGSCSRSPKASSISAGDAMPIKGQRFSVGTMESASTKLGEVSGSNKTGRRRQRDDSFATHDVSLRPTYPLRPYHPKTQTLKMRLWDFVAGR